MDLLSPRLKGFAKGANNLNLKLSVTELLTKTQPGQFLGEKGPSSRRTMARCSESPRKATRLIPFLTPRGLPSLPPGTMYKTGKAARDRQVQFIAGGTVRDPIGQ